MLLAFFPLSACSLVPSLALSPAYPVHPSFPPAPHTPPFRCSPSLVSLSFNVPHTHPLAHPQAYITAGGEPGAPSSLFIPAVIYPFSPPALFTLSAPLYHSIKSSFVYIHFTLTPRTPLRSISIHLCCFPLLTSPPASTLSLR